MASERGKWGNYDDATLVAEMRTIPQPDRGLLFFSMERYAKGDEAGFVLKSYGEGLLMPKKDKRSGRSLFFAYDPDERTTLVLLLAYKKEKDEVPAQLIDAARTRMRRYLEARRGEK